MASVALTPIGVNLQHHLIHHYHKSSPLSLGQRSQLETVVKIKNSDVVNACFSSDGTPTKYPALPPRESLVACMVKDTYTTVIALYTLDQMIEAKACDGLNAIKRVEWCVLEMSEALEAELLNFVDFERRTLTNPTQNVIVFYVNPNRCNPM